MRKPILRSLCLMLALVLCLGLWACGLNADEMKEILCYGEWVSEDNIDDTIGFTTLPSVKERTVTSGPSMNSSMTI